MAAVPVLARLAPRLRLVDRPGARKVHTTPVPRVGGIAMAVGAAAALSVAGAGLPEIYSQRGLAFLAAASVIVAFGAADDRWDLDPRIKLLGQMLAVAIVTVFGGVWIEHLTFGDRVALPLAVSVPVTFLCLVGVTNAINLSDGLDGLAGGTTLLSLVALAMLAHTAGDAWSATLALAFAGAVLGFLRFNTHPASVFMGDAGSQLLGFSVAVLALCTTQSPATAVSAMVPVLLLGIPILDTLWVMVRRVADGRSPFSPDRNHFHHKLLVVGFDHHEAVAAIYVLQGVLFVAAIALRFQSDALILATYVGFCCAVVGSLEAARARGWRIRRAPAAGHAPATSPLGTFIHRLRAAHALPAFALAAVCLLLLAYAGFVVSKAAVGSLQDRGLVGAILLVAVLHALLRRGRPLHVVDRAVLYVTVAMLVYLDAGAPAVSRWGALLEWAVPLALALATLLRLRVTNDARFRLNSLDLIVLFAVLVLPNLPGLPALPQSVTLAITKLVALLYALELLTVASETRPAWLRGSTVAVLALLFLAPFGGF
jgi:UDP-GlcNAc:undecaprenyl-phosphate GlcNAc-1-phosphate transferase